MDKDIVSAEDRIYGVSEENGRFYCTECHSEVPLDEDCPECKRHVNWDKFNIELHRQIP
jgi:Zn finger protein HypA/HybF involved in hydrogenase expression